MNVLSALFGAIAIWFGKREPYEIAMEELMTHHLLTPEYLIQSWDREISPHVFIIESWEKVNGTKFDYYWITSHHTTIAMTYFPETGSLTMLCEDSVVHELAYEAVLFVIRKLRDEGKVINLVDRQRAIGRFDVQRFKKFCADQHAEYLRTGVRQDVCW